MTSLAVLGSPIAHSLSPALHRAAYAALALDWSYQAVELAAPELGAFLDELGPEWRGLSLTMPHKQVVMSLADEIGPVAREVGVANTLLLDGGRRRAFNTDVAGVAGALGDHGIREVRSATVLGAGATALSAIAALASLRAREVRLAVREPERAAAAVELGHRLGMEMSVERFADVGAEATDHPEVVISTLPGDAAPSIPFPSELRRAALLLDVAYDPWPSPLARSWAEAGGAVANGREMLLHQAVRQVRIFVGGDPGIPLADEPSVVDAMRSAVGLSG